MQEGDIVIGVPGLAGVWEGGAWNLGVIALSG